MYLLKSAWCPQFGISFSLYEKTGNPRIDTSLPTLYDAAYSSSFDTELHVSKPILSELDHTIELHTEADIERAKEKNKSPLDTLVNWIKSGLWFAVCPW